MDEATIVSKILMQLLQPKMHKGINAVKSHYFPSPPDMKATMYYIKHSVVCKTKYF